MNRRYELSPNIVPFTVSFVLSTLDVEVGDRVAAWDGQSHSIPGTVTEIAESGTVTVTWSQEQTPGVPGSVATRFLTTALASGVLIRLR